LTHNGHLKIRVTIIVVIGKPYQEREIVLDKLLAVFVARRHHIQHNDSQHKDTRHNWIICDTQRK
jgi:hypothetical protein